jgi:NNP family nitrate/nitrite transporter-like MFS transporter
MGITGAGTMGVVLDAVFAPWFAERWGWQNAFGALMAPLILTLIVYVLIAKDAPVQRKPITLANYKALLRDSDSWWFMFFYSITFGGFVGLANALPLYFSMQYHVSGVAAGLMVALIVMFGSTFRPVGGYIADRIGGIRTLLVLLSVVATAYFVISQMPAGPEPADAATGGWSFLDMPAIAWISVLLFSSGVLALGMGNGAVFQLIPQRFRHEIGTMTGLVGCTGGIGGFFLAQTLGLSKSTTGDFAAGFIVFGLLAVTGLLALARLKGRWRTTWGALTEARI